MNVVEKILEQTSVIIAFAAVATQGIFAFIGNQAWNWEDGFFLFSVTYLVYSFFRNHYKLGSKKRMMILYLTLTVIAIISFFKFNLQQQTQIVIYSLIAIAYNFKLNNFQSFRKIFFLKPLIVLLVWLGMSIVPFDIQSLFYLPIFWAQVLILLVLVLIADYFDQEEDQIKTMVHILGKSKMKGFLIGLLALSLLLIYLSISMTAIKIPLIFANCLLARNILKMDRYQKKWQQYLYFDGILIFQAVVCLIFNL